MTMAQEEHRQLGYPMASLQTSSKYDFCLLVQASYGLVQWLIRASLFALYRGDAAARAVFIYPCAPCVASIVTNSC